MNMEKRKHQEDLMKRVGGKIIIRIDEVHWSEKEEKARFDSVINYKEYGIERCRTLINGFKVDKLPDENTNFIWVLPLIPHTIAVGKDMRNPLVVTGYYSSISNEGLEIFLKDNRYKVIEESELLERPGVIWDRVEKNGWDYEYRKREVIKENVIV